MKADPPWTPFYPVENTPELGDNVTFLNSRYQVSVRRFSTKEFGEALHLSIKRRDKAPIRNWRELQRIKNEICGPECEGVELFPAEGRLVDSANQFHLFVFENYRFPFGFKDRFISESTLPGGRQEPFEDRPADCGSRDEEAKRTADSIQTRIALRKAKDIVKK